MCAVCHPGFLSGAFLGNRIPYIDDIWYVGGARAEGAHAEFWVWHHMLINYQIYIIYSKNAQSIFSRTVCSTLMIFGTKVWLGLKVCMLNFECDRCWSPGTPGVKNVKTMLYDYQTWSQELLMQGEDDGDLYGGQRSSEVECGKLYAMAAIFGQKNH